MRTHDHGEGGIDGGGHIRAPEVSRHQRLIDDGQDACGMKAQGVRRAFNTVVYFWGPVTQAARRKRLKRLA